MTAISIRLDTTALSRCLDKAARDLTKNLRSAVDKSARAARKAAIPVMAEDMRVPAARFRASVPTIKGTTQSSLIAVWEIGKSDNAIRPVSDISDWHRGQPIEAATDVLTGGGSAALDLKRGFVIRANGGTFIASRSGPGKEWRTGGDAPLKAIKAESAGTAMGQSDAIARVVWRNTAEASLSALATDAITKAFGGSSSRAAIAKFDIGSGE